MVIVIGSELMSVGCDFHPSWQQIAVFDPETGEIAERKLMNGDGEAERFYRQLESPALIGIEACGNSQWFLELASGWATRCGSAMRPRFAPAMCASRRRTGGMRRTF